MSEKRKYDLLNASFFFFLSFVLRTISRTQKLYNSTTIEKEKKRTPIYKNIHSQLCTNEQLYKKKHYGRMNTLIVNLDKTVQLFVAVDLEKNNISLNKKIKEYILP
jgi:hypothetical protein